MGAVVVGVGLGVGVSDASVGTGVGGSGVGVVVASGVGELAGNAVVAAPSLGVAARISCGVSGGSGAGADVRFPRGAGIVATAPPGVGACSPQASISAPALAGSRTRWLGVSPVGPNPGASGNGGSVPPAQSRSGLPSQAVTRFHWKAGNPSSGDGRTERRRPLVVLPGDHANLRYSSCQRFRSASRRRKIP